MNDLRLRLALVAIADGDARDRQHAVEVLSPIIARSSRRHYPDARPQRDLDDTEQLALIRLWRSASRYDPSRPARPFLATIVARSAKESQRRRPLAFRDLEFFERERRDDLFEDAIEGHERDPQEIVAELEEAHRVGEIVEGLLTLRECVAWTLIDLADETLVAAGNAIADDVKAADNAAVRARRKLAAWAEREERRQSRGS